MCMKHYQRYRRLVEETKDNPPHTRVTWSDLELAKKVLPSRQGKRSDFGAKVIADVRKARSRRRVTKKKASKRRLRRDPARERFGI